MGRYALVLVSAIIGLGLLGAGGALATPAAPALQSPATGASVTAPVTFQWYAVTGAVYYQVQVATTSSFGTLVYYHGSSTTGNTWTGGTPGTYYWHVCAYDSTGTGGQGPWSDTRSFTIPTAAPAAPALYAPANGSTTTSSTVAFYWHAVTGATYYQLQVATTTGFSPLTFYHGSTATNLDWTATAPGTYYWRVCALNGTVQGPWSDVWHFTIPTPAPAAPALYAPANGSTITSSTVAFYWHAVTNATYYQLQVATTTGFSPLTYYHGSTTTNLNWTGGTPGTYYWRVCALNGTVQGPWSDVWSFTIPTAAPAAPALYAPANGSTTSAPINFYWHAVTGATYYQLQVCTSTAFTTLSFQHGSTGTSQTWSDPPHGHYYWRVCAYAGSVPGNWSSAWGFTITAPPLAQVVLTAPGNGSTASAPTLQWGAVTGVTSYGVQVATDSAFTHTVISESDTGTSRAWLSAPPGTYYWRVYAVGTGSYGPWSAVWSFTVPGTVLAPPVLTAPANAATVPNVVTLQWNAATGATSYYIHVANDAKFTQMVLAQTTTATHLALPTQTVGTTLYWCVASLGSGTTYSGFSAPWSFTVGTTPPLAAPVLTAPDDGATGVSSSALLEWDPVDGATSYYVQVASDAAFTNRLFIGSTTATQQQLTGLPAGGAVYWRVMSLASGRTGTWSDVWSFTTVSASSP
jgi:hypothetical protein